MKTFVESNVIFPGILSRGDCEEAKSMSTFLHILINLLSTALLGASNYTMQCLHAPTRAQVDEAHAQRKWVDIGIPSWRNRHRVSKKDVIMWWILAWSSAPLHLLYNSSVFLEVSAQNYDVAFISQANAFKLVANDTGHNLASMTWQQCSSAFENYVIFGYSSLLLVTPETEHPLVNFGNNITQILPPEFIYPNMSEVKLGSQIEWRRENKSVAISRGRSFPVVSCLNKPLKQQSCKLKFSVPIIVVVIFCNLSKVLCMALTVWYSKETKLVTLGDAIASFLEISDPITKDLCLMSKDDVQQGRWTRPKAPEKWTPITEKTFYAANARRFFIVNISSVPQHRFANFGSFVLFTCACFLASALTGMISAHEFRKGVGFGDSMSQAPALLDTNVRNDNTWGILFNVLLANIPQSLVSLLNLFYNGLLTSFLLGEEWTNLAHQQQPLRVTEPKGSQRSQYYLTIPYQYGIPAMVLSTIFHWLVAESFFLVRITAMHQGIERLEDSISSLGYSPLAIALAGIICCLMLALVDLKARQRLKQASPLASHCSAAISAACHPPRDEDGLETRPIQWGVVQGAGESIGSWKKRGKDFGHSGL
ncbi:hypothetical protein HYFRA_00004882 [Hymenoscyphus fraxineus]|uniref:DUF6536 domain-containing protein n=1 Tax=Hymenoscyphus fraxineus TaxID=746836 RepID=A0A9N9KPI4_9HELO|nr:hypothetical protein HYFRA_00004882 [Hymenoscyphus fraxineus]